MRESIIIGFIVGTFFAAISAIVAALAIKNATPSLLWDIVLWGGVAMLLCSIATLALYTSAQNSGRFLLWPALLINTGLCLIVGGLVWHLAGPTTDSDYLIYKADIQNPSDLRALLPIVIGSPSFASFDNVDQWWSPWNGGNHSPYPQDSTNPYWSIGAQMKVVIPFVRGGTLYGRSIPANDYFIESNTSFKGMNYHFDERLNIFTRNGQLVQEIDVWRTIGDGKRTLVYSGDGT